MALFVTSHEGEGNLTQAVDARVTPTSPVPTWTMSVFPIQAIGSPSQPFRTTDLGWNEGLVQP